MASIAGVEVPRRRDALARQDRAAVGDERDRQEQIDYLIEHFVAAMKQKRS